MDQETIRYYDSNAAGLSERYAAAEPTHIRTLLARWLNAGQLVLEIGCGCGRDAAYMANLGCVVTATDASEAMLSCVPPEWRGSARFLKVTFPLRSDDALLQERFDAVVAIAVLMHLPDGELFDFAYQVRTLLRDGGLFVCSFCSGRELASGDSRLYVHRESEQVQLLFERLGFRLVSLTRNPDDMGRDHEWTNLVMQVEGQLAARPLDQIESIINRDRNTATYKLALLRALCEIAQTGFRHVRWHPDGVVSVPLGLIVAKWISYYWPLIDAPAELPEMRTGKAARGLAFRGQLQELIDSFRPGGIDTFFALFEGGRLSVAQAAKLANAADRIANAVVVGPVTYSGGSLEGVDRVFEYRRTPERRRFTTPTEMTETLGRVYFSANLWREMTLVGHWVAEAIVLRWAALSHRFTKGQVPVAEIVGRLLTRPEATRNVMLARQIYGKLPELSCIWTNRRLSTTRFDVDHVIPFVLWRNNQLWNLLPADAQINNKKRDKIVTRDTLLRSRDKMIHYWEHSHELQPLLFENEVSATLLGDTFPAGNWQSATFTALAEAVEIVALQRGVERWSSV